MDKSRPDPVAEAFGGASRTNMDRRPVNLRLILAVIAALWLALNGLALLLGGWQVLANH